MGKIFDPIWFISSRKGPPPLCDHVHLALKLILCGRLRENQLYKTISLIYYFYDESNKLQNNAT